jgi:hypothetical protein
LFQFNTQPAGFNPFIGQQPIGQFQIGQPSLGNAGFIPGNTGPGQLLQVLQQMLSSLSMLAGGWQGALGGGFGGGFQQPGFQQPGFQQPGYQPPGFQQPGYQPPIYQQPGFQQPGFLPPGIGQPRFTVPQNQPMFYPGYPGEAGRTMAYPTDRGDFASYLQAQVRGGALNGDTGIAQNDGIPGTRFATVQDNSAWNASVARNYAYQFGAYAMGADPLSPQGLEFAAQNWNKMSPDAQLFTQVASVFKGNALGGPGNYDNPGLKQLLIERGFGDIANRPGVGQTDIQTIGAITQALNSGRLSLNDIIQSGTIDNIDRYFNVINYVQGGGFNQHLQFFDNVPV